MGIMNDADRTANHKTGWYHTASLEQALRYAGRTMINDMEAKIVLVFKCLCSNLVHPGSKSSDEYTKSGCLRYHLVSILLIPLYFCPAEKCFAKNPICKRLRARRKDVDYVLAHKNVIGCQYVLDTEMTEAEDESGHSQSVAGRLEADLLQTEAGLLQTSDVLVDVLAADDLAVRMMCE